MMTRDVTGRKIIGVEHNRFYNGHLNRFETVVSRIILDDGAILVPFAFETEDSPEATIFHAKACELNAEGGVNDFYGTI